MMELPKFEPTPYKISTITATGSINTTISLDILFENLSLITDDMEEGIVYAEFGSRKTETVYKGYTKKLANKKTDSKKRFDNQVTIVYKFNDKDNKCVMINSKIFKNGNVQMTGIRNIYQGQGVIDYIISQVKLIHIHKPEVVCNVDELKNTNYSVRLINCDFRTGLEFKRDKLYKIILTDYNISCTYEPCIYPGVKIQYAFNNDNEKRDGCCYCDKYCSGKGCGNGNTQCKKITIAVFQSGCIIITGGQSIEQINEAYAFICNCIRKNISEIYKVNMILPIEDVKKRKVYIKKSSIRGVNDGIK
jgi:TATA-box binding protein (TBP) (component of TFIID and TFIIIB)